MAHCRLTLLSLMEKWSDGSLWSLSPRGRSGVSDYGNLFIVIVVPQHPSLCQDKILVRVRRVKDLGTGDTSQIQIVITPPLPPVSFTGDRVTQMCFTLPQPPVSFYYLWVTQVVDELGL